MRVGGSEQHSDELAGEVAGQVMDVVAAITARWEELLARSTLTSGQVKLLRYLLVDGPSTMGGVAQELRCDPSLATVAVDRLESRGLVRRVPDATDRRIRRVDLTDEGAELVRSVWSEMRDATPVGRLDDGQLHRLRDILAVMLDR